MGTGEVALVLVGPVDRRPDRSLEAAAWAMEQVDRCIGEVAREPAVRDGEAVTTSATALERGDVVAALSEVALRASAKAGHELGVGISAPAAEPGQLRRCRLEAAMVIGNPDQEVAPLVFSLLDCTLLEYLVAVAPGAADRFVSSAVATLVDGPDREVMETLEAYFHCDLNVRRTAEVLHLHPNTVRYRLRQAARRLGRAELDLPAVQKALIEARLARRSHKSAPGALG